MLGDYFRIALRSLMRSRLRSILTMLGIFVGIAAVVSLYSLGTGLKVAIEDQFEEIGADKLFISLKGTGFGQFNELVENQLTTSDFDTISRVRGIKLVSGQIYAGVTVQSGDETGQFFLLSLPDELEEHNFVKDINFLEVTDGAFIRLNDPRKVMVGALVVQDGLFKKQIRVGSKILVAGETFEVAAVLKRIGDPGVDNGIYMSERAARKLIDNPDTYNLLYAQTAEGADPVRVGEAVKRALRRHRGLDEGNEDFEVQTPDAILATFAIVLDIVTFTLLGIALISLIVGGIGIMNTMYTAVLERTREIGVMKAIGARNNDILALFIIEAGFLGVVGGVIGVFMGWGIAQAVSFGARAALGSDLLQVSLPWYIIIGVLAFSFVVGSIAGALPAYQASQLQPVEALRYE